MPMPTETLLATTYLGNQHYYARLLGGPCHIDGYEHYLKQSYRNRCDILSEGGVMSLVVPVHHRGSVKTPVRDIRIDYSKRWQHRHWQALVSAYRSSPYFFYYEDRFAPFYERTYPFLLDWNLELQALVLELLGAPGPVPLTDRYVEPEDPSGDWRLGISPKQRLSRPDPAYTPPVYYQVFSERFAFVPDLSVVDLPFCEGPASGTLLRQALQPTSEATKESNPQSSNV